MAKSKDQLLANIDNLIVEINSQYEYLKNNSQLEGIDIAMLVGNVDYLSAQIKLLHYCLEQKSANHSNFKESTFFTPGIGLDNEADEQETYDEIENEQTVAMIQEVPKVEIFSAYVEPVEVEESKIIVDQLVNPSIVIDQSKVAVEEQVFVASVDNELSANGDDSPARPLTINELIQQQKQAGINITQQFQTSTNQDKVLDLKVAISLNDKLLFIKDLFNGYSLAYSEALELLNRFDNYAEADAFLQSNYALKNGWVDKPQTVDKFYTLLRKKYN